MNRRLPCAIVVALTLLLAACAASPEKQTYLALPTTPVARASGPAAVQDHAIVVRRISVPEYVDAREVRFRSSNSRIDSFASTVWAERLELGMTREFTGGLRDRLPNWLVCNGACGDRAVDAVVSVDWNTLDLDRATHRLSVDTQWVIIDPNAPRGTASPSGRFSATIDVGNDTADGYAEAISKAVAQLAADVSVRGIPALRR